MIFRFGKRLHISILSLLLTFAMAGAAVPASLAQIPKKPITHETMWLMRRVGAPVPSPDGKWVTFSLIDPAYDEKDQTTDLWIVPADAKSRPRRLTSTKGGESGAVWSPDSKKIAFSAKREGDEASQIYIIDVVDGGEAVRATTVSTGARAPQWSPDGRALLFTSTVYPGAADDEANKKVAAERKGQKYKARVYDKFPIRNWDRWLDDMQPHVFVQTFEAGAKPKDLLAGTKLVAGRGFSVGDNLGATWAPDGKSVLFVASTNSDVAAYANTFSHIFQVPVAGGEPVQITSGENSFGSPTFTPDGKSLYCRITPENDKVYNLTRIASLPWPSPGQPTVITGSFDRSVGSFAFTPDGQTIYLLAEEAGNEKLFMVPASGGSVQLAMDMTRGVYTNLAIPAKAPSTMIFANWESAINPSEIVKIDTAGKTHEWLTEFNVGRAQQIDWQPLRHFWFTSKAGKRIHSMMALPPNFDENKKYPLFVLIHGGPHGMWRDQYFLRWNYHLIAQPGYIVLLTDFTGSTGYGEKFAREIQGDPFIGPSTEINEAADEAIKQFKFIDPAQQAAGGASYGGHLANWLQATTTRYKCLVSHAGLINLESQWGTSDGIYHREVNNGGPVWEQGKVWREQNPIRFAKNFRTPMLLTIGENDFRVPLNQTLENWSVLQRLRIPSRLIVFPEENHWIQKGENSRFFYQELHSWLKTYIGAPNGGSAESR